MLCSVVVELEGYELSSIIRRLGSPEEVKEESKDALAQSPITHEKSTKNISKGALT